ncbi:MAG: hypothetical protein HFJ34_01685 [Clostridia bacterium]|nr:hypothetical protein [Clostridia bacterium]
MEKNVEISMLNQIYGKLLTPKQYEIIEDYYNHDLSLSEIAQNNEITRQAVRDILIKGEKKLYEYEQKLKTKEKELKRQKELEKILVTLTQIQKNEANQEIGNQLKTIKKELKKWM